MSKEKSTREFIVERTTVHRAKITVDGELDYDAARERAEWKADNSTPEDEWHLHDSRIDCLRETEEGVDTPCLTCNPDNS